MGARRLPETVTKRFKVIGKHKIAGVAKGGEVTLTMTPGSMNCLIESGAIEEISAPAVTPPPVKTVKKETGNGSIRS